MITMPLISILLTTIILGYAAFYIRPIIRNIVLIADAVILYSIIDLHDIGNIKTKGLLLLTSLVGILIGFAIAKTLRQSSINITAVLYIIALNFILFIPVISLFLHQYLSAMYIEKMSIIFAETIYVVTAKLILLLVGVSTFLIIISTILTTMNIKLANNTTSIMKILLIFFLVGSLYTLSINLNNTLYFFSNIIKETPSNLNNMRNLADHKGLLYISRVTLEQTNPLSREQTRFHQNVSNMLLSTGIVGLTLLTLLALRAKIKESKN